MTLVEKQLWADPLRVRRAAAEQRDKDRGAQLSLQSHQMRVQWQRRPVPQVCILYWCTHSSFPSGLGKINSNIILVSQGFIYFSSKVNAVIPLSSSRLMGFAFGPVILWTSLLCCLRAALSEKLLVQTLQGKGRMPACSLSCALKVVFVLSILPHVAHSNLGSWCTRMCLLIPGFGQE